MAKIRESIYTPKVRGDKSYTVSIRTPLGQVNIGYQRLNNYSTMNYDHSIEHLLEFGKSMPSHGIAFIADDSLKNFGDDKNSLNGVSLNPKQIDSISQQEAFVAVKDALDALDSANQTLDDAVGQIKDNNDRISHRGDRIDAIQARTQEIYDELEKQLL